MEEDADTDVKKGKDHDSKAKALVMARVIVASNDKIDTPIPALMLELAPLKAMKGVDGFECIRWLRIYLSLNHRNLVLIRRMTVRARKEEKRKG
jgi:hypothetical protein